MMHSAFCKETFERQRDNVREYFEYLSFRVPEIGMASLEDTCSAAVFRVSMPINIDSKEIEAFAQDVSDMIGKPARIYRFRELSPEVVERLGPFELV